MTPAPDSNPAETAPKCFKASCPNEAVWRSNLIHIPENVCDQCRVELIRFGFPESTWEPLSTPPPVAEEAKPSDWKSQADDFYFHGLEPKEAPLPADPSAPLREKIILHSPAEQIVALMEELGYIDFDGGEQQDRMNLIEDIEKIIEAWNRRAGIQASEPQDLSLATATVIAGLTRDLTSTHTALAEAQAQVGELAALLQVITSKATVRTVLKQSGHDYLLDETKAQLDT